MKLSKTKKELILLMREGWECGRDGIYIRLQKLGLGMGGETRPFSRPVLFDLANYGIIERSKTVKFGNEVWELTELGKTIEL